MRRGDSSNLVSVRGGVTTRDVAERFGLQWEPVTIHNQFDVVGDQLRRRTLAAGEAFPQFANNVIPQNMPDPLSLELLRYLPPAGDYFLDTDGSLRNYADSNFIRNLEQRASIRVDHHLTPNNRLGGR